jgi:hypothetical protein
MDLAVYLRVMARFWQLLVCGLALAIALAVVSFVRVDFDGVTPQLQYRSHETWVSASTLFVTQEGFPWGRSILDETIRVGENGGPPTFAPRYGDPGRYSGLAQLYAALARGDAVHRLVLRGAPPGARYEPDVVKSADNSTVLPLIYMKGYGTSAGAAEAIANRAADAFRAYLTREQAKNRIPKAKRVEVVVTSRASPAEVFAARSMARPVFVFLLVVLVFVALAFVLENLRPAPISLERQLRPADADSPEASPAPFRNYG